ncbi:hypothetical protein DH2020_036174 [Rehmannia glutinosa]|uniref:Uncharacterized protein n=1 Tax=Rehmannia glutinosa TaxID=99300 RepID=A0ABR0V7K0_REHGL
MAPKKKRGSESGESSVATRSATRATAKATRGAISRGDAVLTPSVDNPEVIARKKPKTTPADAALTPSVDNPEVIARKKPKTTPADASSSSGATSAASKTIIIEHCTQCKSFKTKANQVKKGLEKAVAGVKVELNPENPREGCFEVREDGGDTFVSMLGVESPFDEIKALDVEKVVSDIVERIR